MGPSSSSVCAEPDPAAAAGAAGAAFAAWAAAAFADSGSRSLRRVNAFRKLASRMASTIGGGSFWSAPAETSGRAITQGLWGRMWRPLMHGQAVLLHNAARYNLCHRYTKPPTSAACCQDAGDQSEVSHFLLTKAAASCSCQCAKAESEQKCSHTNVSKNHLCAPPGPLSSQLLYMTYFLKNLVPMQEACGTYLAPHLACLSRCAPAAAAA